MLRISRSRCSSNYRPVPFANKFALSHADNFPLHKTRKIPTLHHCNVGTINITTVVPPGFTLTTHISLSPQLRKAQVSFKMVTESPDRIKVTPRWSSSVSCKDTSSLSHSWHLPQIQRASLSDTLHRVLSSSTYYILFKCLTAL